MTADVRLSTEKKKGTKKETKLRLKRWLVILAVANKATQASYNAPTPKRLRKKKKKKNKNKKKKVVEAILPQKEHDPALPDPNDFHIKALEHKIGETIELPDLSGSAKQLLKEFQPHKLQRIILTPQRCALSKEFARCGPSGWDRGKKTWLTPIFKPA